MTPQGAEVDRVCGEKRKVPVNVALGLKGAKVRVA
jgi:hypothetical protein